MFPQMQCDAINNTLNVTNVLIENEENKNKNKK